MSAAGGWRVLSQTRRRGRRKRGHQNDDGANGTKTHAQVSCSTTSLFNTSSRGSIGRARIGTSSKDVSPCAPAGGKARRKRKEEDDNVEEKRLEEEEDEEEE
eukprot:7558271-Pyramimonas_sp.AAC.1